MRPQTRRRFTALLGVGLSVGLAGCNRGPTEEPQTTEHSTTPPTTAQPVQTQFSEESVRPGSQATLVVSPSEDSAVVISSPQLSPSQLDAMIDGTRTDSGLQVHLPSNNEIPVTITEAFDCHSGTYTFTVRGTDTGTTDEATINVQRVPQPSVFTQSTYTLDAESATTVVIQLHCTDTVRLRLDSLEESNQPVVEASIFAADSDDTVTVEITRGTDPAELLTAKTGTVREITITPEYLPLNGSYKLSLFEGDSVEDVASLSVSTADT